MNEEIAQTQPPTGRIPETRSEPQENRFRATVDLLYLGMQIYLYIASFFTPLFGIIFGAVYMTSARHPQAKKIGRICLILGIINLVLGLIFFIIFAVIGGGILEIIGRLGGGYYY